MRWCHRYICRRGASTAVSAAGALHACAARLAGFAFWFADGADRSVLGLDTDLQAA